MSAREILLSDAPSRRLSRSKYFSPISIALARSVVLMTCLILLRAFDVLTIPSQSLEGRWPFCRRISTTSPLRIAYFKGTMRPLTFAPTHSLPTLVWTAYAKSIGDAPRGSTITLPCGVNAYTSSGYKSTFNVDMKSPGSRISCCHSTNCRSHAIR